MLAGAPSDPSMIDPAGTEGQPCGRTHRVGSKGMVPRKEAFSRVSKKADTPTRARIEQARQHNPPNRVVVL